MALEEKPLEKLPGMSVGSGVIIQEKDGRFWLAHPTNGYGGVRATFPKGTLEPNLTLQENAIKEAFEESGLIVRITGIVGDVVRTTSVARFYHAVRIGGNPTQFHWETEAVSLVPKNQLKDYLNQAPDFKLLAML